MVRRTIGKWAAWKWAAVATAGVALVAGCGQLRIGAAAIYGGQRITSAKLADEVANLTVGYQAYKSKLQISYTSAEMPQRVLSWMLRFATAEKVAADRGITITPEKAQQELTAESAQTRQAGITLREAAVANGLPPDMLPELGRWLAIESALENQLDAGHAPTTQAGSQTLNAKMVRVQCLAAKSLAISVNPQYGAYDYSQSTVVSIPSRLSGPAKRVTASTPKLSATC